MCSLWLNNLANAYSETINRPPAQKRRAPAALISATLTIDPNILPGLEIKEILLPLWLVEAEPTPLPGYQYWQSYYGWQR